MWASKHIATICMAYLVCTMTIVATVPSVNATTIIENPVDSTRQFFAPSVEELRTGGITKFPPRYFTTLETLSCQLATTVPWYASNYIPFEAFLVDYISDTALPVAILLTLFSFWEFFHTKSEVEQVAFDAAGAGIANRIGYLVLALVGLSFVCPPRFELPHDPSILRTLGLPDVTFERNPPPEERFVPLWLQGTSENDLVGVIPKEVPGLATFATLIDMNDLTKDAATPLANYCTFIMHLDQAGLGSSTEGAKNCLVESTGFSIIVAALTVGTAPTTAIVQTKYAIHIVAICLPAHISNCPKARLQNHT